MTVSPFFLLSSALQASLNNTIDLDTNDFYAILMKGSHQPAAADSTVASLGNGTTGAITAATQANPCSITSTAHGRTTGDVIFITSVVGMVELNTHIFKITVVDANTFTLDGIDATAYTAYTSGGTWEVFPECANVDYVRQAVPNATNNIITVGTKKRAFDCADISFGTTVTVSAKYLYLVKGTAATPLTTDLLIGFMDLNEVGGDITAITAANPGAVTSAAHGLATSDVVAITQCEMETADRDIFTITVSDANTFTIGDMSAESLPARNGHFTKLNDATETASTASAFNVTIPTTGLIVFG